MIVDAVYTDRAIRTGDKTMHISNKIKQLRIENHLTQDQLAQKINVSRQSVLKWESGTNYPNIENILVLSEALNISIDELIKTDLKLENKLIIDSKARKYHLLVMLFLVSIIIYIGYWFLVHHILMIGFLISTVFMLFIELKVFFTGKLLEIF